MPNWAELHEISKTLKVPHGQVKYVSQSKNKNQRCQNCENYIPGFPSRCRTVECPIAPQGWCVRYEPE